MTAVAGELHLLCAKFAADHKLAAESGFELVARSGVPVSVVCRRVRTRAGDRLVPSLSFHLTTKSSEMELRFRGGTAPAWAFEGGWHRRDGVEEDEHGFPSIRRDRMREATKEDCREAAALLIGHCQGRYGFFCDLLMFPRAGGRAVRFPAAWCVKQSMGHGETTGTELRP